MLIRYIAGTLVILGAAMLVAPQRSDEDVALPAPGPTDPNPSASGTEIVSLDRATAQAAWSAYNDGGGPPEAEPRARFSAPARSSSTDAPETQSGDSLTQALADAAQRIAEDAARNVDPAPIPTLEQLDTLLRPTVTAETLALAPPITTAETPLGDEPEPQVEIERRYISGTRVNLRAGPSTIDAVLGSVSQDMEVELLGEAGPNWSEIRLESGQTGFIARRYLAERPTGG